MRACYTCIVVVFMARGVSAVVPFLDMPREMFMDVNKKPETFSASAFSANGFIRDYDRPAPAINIVVDQAPVRSTALDTLKSLRKEERLHRLALSESREDPVPMVLAERINHAPSKGKSLHPGNWMK